MGFRCKFLASRADEAGEIEAEVGTEEAGERGAIWVKNRCKSRADDERRDELADDEAGDLDGDREGETVGFRADNWANSRVSRAGEADEIDEADEADVEAKRAFSWAWAFSRARASSLAWASSWSISFWAWASFFSAASHIAFILSYSWALCSFDISSHSSSMGLNVWAICRFSGSNACSSCFLAFEEKIISWPKLTDAFIFSSFKLFIDAFIVAEVNVSLPVVPSLPYSVSWKW